MKIANSSVSFVFIFNLYVKSQVSCQPVTWLTVLEKWSLILRRGRNFLLATKSEPTPGPPTLLHNGNMGSIPCRLKSQSEMGQSPQPSVKVKNAQCFISTEPTSLYDDVIRNPDDFIYLHFVCQVKCQYSCITTCMYKTCITGCMSLFSQNKTFITVQCQ